MCGIIYCLARKDTYGLATFLQVVWLTHETYACIWPCLPACTHTLPSLMQRCSRYGRCNSFSNYCDASAIRHMPCFSVSFISFCAQVYYKSSPGHLSPATGLRLAARDQRSACEHIRTYESGQALRKLLNVTQDLHVPGLAAQALCILGCHTAG